MTDVQAMLREYPNFFAKLYNLLDEEALHVRYRPRFMRMLDIFLASPYAAFIFSCLSFIR